MYQSIVKPDIISFKVKGMTMYNIHPDYLSDKIIKYVTDVIIDYHYDRFSQLSDEQKAEFTSLLCEAAGNDEFSCITESSSSSQTINLFRQALIGSRDDNEKFLEAIKKNAVAYHLDNMQKIFNAVLEDLGSAKAEWLDTLLRHGDPDDAYDSYRQSLMN